MGMGRNLAQTPSSRLQEFLAVAKAVSGGDSSKEIGVGARKQNPSFLHQPHIKCTCCAGSWEVPRRRVQFPHLS